MGVRGWEIGDRRQFAAQAGSLYFKRTPWTEGSGFFCSGFAGAVRAVHDIRFSMCGDALGRVALWIISILDFGLLQFWISSIVDCGV